MFAKILAGAVFGYEAMTVTVEADSSPGLPSFDIVGLPDTSISEARRRIKTAMTNSGCSPLKGEILINLSPADVKKEGSGFDLPILTAILTSGKQLDPSLTEGWYFIGELGLNGELKHTRGVLPIALMALEKGCKGLVLPRSNSKEALVVPGLKVVSFKTVSDFVAAFSGKKPIVPDVSCPEPTEITEADNNLVDMCTIKGQTMARRAIEIAAAGAHNIILAGPPGSGKTLLAKAIPTIMPPLEFDEALEVTGIYSIKGLLPEGSGLIRQRPFREPHHTISDTALIGGGRVPTPGEVSLAHNGVLFLDELPEFKKSVLEVLREPLTSGKVTISRAASTCSFPSRFLLAAAMNPCPCGFLTDPVKECVCTAAQQQRYKAKISGPLLDRIDLHINVPRLTPEELTAKPEGESSAVVRARVMKAREIQKRRSSLSHGIMLNAYIPARMLKKCCKMEPSAEALLLAAARKFALSARGYDKIIRIARTIADLAGSDLITAAHTAEALQYRTADLFK